MSKTYLECKELISDCNGILKDVIKGMHNKKCPHCGKQVYNNE